MCGIPRKVLRGKFCKTCRQDPYNQQDASSEPCGAPPSCKAVARAPAAAASAARPRAISHPAIKPPRPLRSLRPPAVGQAAAAPPRLPLRPSAAPLGILRALWGLCACRGSCGRLRVPPACRLGPNGQCRPACVPLRCSSDSVPLSLRSAGLHICSIIFAYTK